MRLVYQYIFRAYGIPTSLSKKCVVTVEQGVCLQHFHELIEKVVCVGWAWGGFGVELAGEKWKLCVLYAFVCVVVEVF